MDRRKWHEEKVFSKTEKKNFFSAPRVGEKVVDSISKHNFSCSLSAPRIRHSNNVTLCHGHPTGFENVSFCCNREENNFTN